MFPHFIYTALLESKRTSCNQALSSSKQNKRQWRAIGRVVSALLARSPNSFFKKSVAPSLGPFPDKHPSSTPPISCARDCDTPAETNRVSESTGGASAQHAIEGLFSIGSSPIPAHQTLEIPVIVNQYQDSDLSRTHDLTQSVRCPSPLVPDELERVSQRSVRIDLARAGAVSEVYSPPQLRAPQAECDGINQTFTNPLRSLLARSSPSSIARSNAHRQRSIPDDSPSKGTDLFPIDPSPSPLDNGTYETNTSTDESVSRILRSFIHSQSNVAAARERRGEEAQELINIINQATAAPGLDEELRNQCLYLLYKMCKDCKMLPTSYILQQESLSIGDFKHRGGFADINTGDCLGRRVAVKRLRFWAEDGPDWVFKLFCREIIAWKRLSHPNVLPLLGVSFSTDTSSFLMVSAWMENGNVMEYTKSNPGANRLELLSGVMSGVSYLHGLGVIHGDLKGANILVDDNSVPLLGDFGLAAVSVDLNTVTLSATAVSFACTTLWASPEVLFEGSPPTQKSDSYSLGMVIYEVLTGHRPFHRLPAFAPLAAIKEGKRPDKPVNAISLGFSDRLWGLVEQCWDKSPSIRPTAEDLLHCLQDVSPTWASLENPIPDGPDGEASPDSISPGEQIATMDASTSSPLVPRVIMLCAFMLLFH